MTTYSFSTQSGISETDSRSHPGLSRRAMLAGLLSIAMGRKLVAKKASTGAIMTDFVPWRHGFHFSNRFRNVVLDIPGIHLVTRGRCGGMAYSALDYYFARRPVPLYTQVPESGEESVSSPSYSPEAYCLVHYLFWRQIDTMKAIWPFGRASDFLFYTLASDQDLFQQMIGSEAEKLTYWLQAGVPVPLGLIGVRNVMRIGENHQVVCYGYGVDSSTHALSTLFIYDPNYPDQKVTLSMNKTRKCLDASIGRTWRGFFVRDDYTPHAPPSKVLNQVLL